MSTAKIPVIGIIGGIGSGKTAIANAVGEYLNVCRIDADAVGHQVLMQIEVKEALRRAFGAAIFDQSGEVSRSKLAELVFGQGGEQSKARKVLEQIVHPEIHSFIEKQLKEIKDQRSFDVIILDAALLLEAGWSAACDAVVYLEVPEEIRLQRVQKRGWPSDQFIARELSQWPLEQKKTRADIVIDNSGDLRAAAKKIVSWIHTNWPTTLAAGIEI